MNQPTLDLFGVVEPEARPPKPALDGAVERAADEGETSPAEPTSDGPGEVNAESALDGLEASSFAAEPVLPARKKPKRRATAQSMAGKHRAIAISEFFTKNRHLLGFDNPAKALLTTVREAVDNSLDACEEAGILPDITIEITKVDGESDRFRVLIRDLGPGIVKRQIGKIFGKLLYGSKFHRLKQSRGQQGIGISAAGMYARITTGKPVVVTTRTGARRPINHAVLQIDTKRNEPKFLVEEELAEWPYEHGTEIIMEIGATYKGGRHSVDEFLRQTALSNPHAYIHYTPPIGKPVVYERQVHELPFEPEEIQPHPHGIELGILMHMMSDTKQRNLSDFLCNDFCRIPERIAEEMITAAAKGISGRGPKAMMRRSPKAMDRSEAEALYKVMQATELRGPPTNCLSPIGPDEMKAGLFHLFDPGEYSEDEFFVTSETRKPTVYRGNPFQVEVGLVYGKGLAGDKPAGVYRYANRVPLQYQAGACAVTKAVTGMNWRQYGLNQPRGAVPVAPLMITVHIASGWMPYTSESKEAIAHYPEILAELRLALQVCARRLQVHLRRRRREADEEKKRAYINNYLPPIAEALVEILKLESGAQKVIVDNLELIIDDSRGEV